MNSGGCGICTSNASNIEKTCMKTLRGAERMNGVLGRVFGGSDRYIICTLGNVRSDGIGFVPGEVTV